MGKFERFFIYTLTVFSGMAVMSLEMASSRLYAPYFGSSIFVWSALINALLLFLCIGYFLGGYLSRKRASIRTLSLIVLSACIYGGASPYIAYPIMNSFSSSPQNSTDIILRVFLTSTASMAFPLILLGCVVPLSVKLLSASSEQAGQTSGTIYAASTFGSIIGGFYPLSCLSLFTVPDLLFSFSH